MIETILTFLAGVIVTFIVSFFVVKNNKAKILKLIAEIDFDAIVAKAGSDAKAISAAIKAKIAELK